MGTWETSGNMGNKWEQGKQMVTRKTNGNMGKRAHGKQMKNVKQMGIWKTNGNMGNK